MNEHQHDAFELTPDDRRLLDHLAEHGFEPRVLNGLRGDDRARAQRLLSLFSLLEDYPVDDADDTLIHATLARIRRSDERAARLDTSENARQIMAGGRFRWRIPDLVSLAAVVLIGASILFPVLQMVRQRSVAATCATNMASLGQAFQVYARDYDNHVPWQAAGYGSPAKLLDPLPLVSAGYCSHGHANCPGHGVILAGYSYQIHIAPEGQTLRWRGHPDEVILGDRNPIQDARRSASLLSPLTNSQNHAARGQNILQRDLSAHWMPVPVRGSDDNIWLPAGATETDLGGLPANPMDTVLTN